MADGVLGLRIHLREGERGHLRLEHRVVTEAATTARYFNDVAISNATRSTLTLRRLQATNSGLYSVRVTNSVGTVTSLPAELTVQ